MNMSGLNQVPKVGSLLSDPLHKGCGATSDQLFPKARSAEILRELSAWTSVADIMVAARILEGRTIPGDQPESMLLMPLQYEEPEFSQIFVMLLGYLIDGYIVPSQKVEVCRALDPKITDATAFTLQSLRFKPTVHAGRFQEIGNRHAFAIQDQPAVIELIRAPLICLMGLFLDKYEYAKPLHNMVSDAENKTGGRPTIFHRPYADAYLPSFIEAACFFSLGLDVGTRFALPGHINIETEYRAVNVQVVPPVDPAVLRSAFQHGQRMLNALR